jgi:isoleucyl-tRNA synthetase
MDQYDHMKAVRKIQEFVSEDLSNWYIRRARRRFWAEELTQDKKSVYATTYEILVGVSKLSAPFAPFIADEIYTKLTGGESVHISFYPEPESELIDDNVENRMDLVRTLVALGRGVREKERIKVRQPLSGIIIDGKYEQLIADLTPLIEEELNVKEVIFEKELEKYMDYSIKPDFKTAGPVLGAKIKAFGSALSNIEPALLIRSFGEEGSVKMMVDGEEIVISKDFIDVRISAKEGFAAAMENNVFTILDTKLNRELIQEGLAREVISKVQQLRKQNDFEMMDNINIYLEADDEVKEAVKKFKAYIMKETLAVGITERGGISGYDINGHKTGIDVEKVS